jgi:hypothetical protein
MSQEIINVLEYIGGKLGIALDWTSENIWPQVLDVLGRYRILQIVISCIWFAVALIALVVFICLWIKILKAYLACIKDKQDNLWWNWLSYHGNADGTGFVVIMIILSGIAALLIIPTLIIEPGEILKWTFIPEIQFLELFKSMTG